MLLPHTLGLLLALQDLLGAWAGGFGSGERYVAGVLRIEARGTGHEASFDRLDSIAAPSRATEVEVAEDSLTVFFGERGSVSSTLVLERGDAGLTGFLEVGSGEQSFPASFAPMADPGRAALLVHAGLYEAEGGERVRLGADGDGTLVAHFPADDRMQMLFPAGPGRFFAGSGPLHSVPASVEVVLAEGVLAWTENGATRSFQRLEAPFPETRLAADAIRRGELVMPLVRIAPGTFAMGQKAHGAHRRHCSGAERGVGGPPGLRAQRHPDGRRRGHRQPLHRLVDPLLAAQEQRSPGGVWRAMAQGC